MAKHLYITGLHGSSNKGLGKFLNENHRFDVLEINQTFDKHPFDQKIEIIQKAIYNKEKIVASSFGAYLLLHSLTFKVECDLLLISPVLGMAIVNGGGRIPPNFSGFKRKIENKELYIPDKTKIISGEDDEICPVGNINFLKACYTNIEVEIIPSYGHKLPKEIIAKKFK